MRKSDGKNNYGLLGGIFEKKHRDKIGAAIWLFGWLCARQTKLNGLVHGGKPFTYRVIAEDMGESARTIEKWMARLKSDGYVLVKHTTFKRMVIYVLNQKKFRSKQASLFDKEPMFHHASQRDKKKSFHHASQRDLNHANQRDHAPQPAGFKHELNMEERAAEEISSLSAFEVLGITLSLWTDFRKMREKIHRPLIPGATDLIVKELFDLQARGESPVRVLEQAISTASFRLYPVRKENGNGERETFGERRNRKSIEGIAAAFGRSPDGLVSEDRCSLSPGHPERERSGLPRITERSFGAAVGCSISPSHQQKRIHADGRDDSERASRTGGSGDNTFDICPISGDRSDGEGLHAGNGSVDRELKKKPLDPQTLRQTSIAVKAG